MEDKTISNTLSDVKDQVVANNLADTLAEAGTVGQALSKVHAKVLIYQLPHMLPEIKTKTLGATLSDMEAKALVHTLADTLPEARAERHCETLSVVKVGALSDLLANTLAEREAERIGDRVINVEAERLIDMLVVSIKESSAETFGTSKRYAADGLKRPSKAGAETLRDRFGKCLGLGTNRHAARGHKRSTDCEAWRLIG